MASTLSFLGTPDNALASPYGILELPRSDSYSGENRRFLPRLGRRFRVFAQGHERMTGIDLSFGGMLCIGAVPVWPGNELAITLELDESTTVGLSAKVVELVACQSQIGMRMRFCEISSKSRRAIAHWMATTIQDRPSR